MKKVSVIVPVYNAETTLAACLGNLVHQTLDDIEIILVNDASTDSSPQILEYCKEQFPDRVVLINADHNLGSGGARNLALDAAQGEYVGFVDADDLADVHMYEKMYEAAKAGNHDFVDCAFLDIRRDIALCTSGEEDVGILDDVKRSNLIFMQGYLWSKLIRRQLLEKPVKVRQRTGVILEDMDIITWLYAAAYSTAHVVEILYKYNDRPDSASKLTEPEAYYHSMYAAMEAIYERTHKLPNYEGIRDAVEYAILHVYNDGVIITDKAREAGLPLDTGKMLRDIAILRNRIVRLKKYSENSYVMKRFKTDDLKRLAALDGSEL